MLNILRLHIHLCHFLSILNIVVVIADSGEFAFEVGGDFGRADVEFEQFMVLVLVVVDIAVIAFGTDGGFDGFGDVILEVILVDFDPDHGTKERRDQVTANKHHIKVQNGIEGIRKVTPAFEFNKYLISANLKVLIDIAEECHGVVLKVLAGVHDHRVEDEPVEHDDDGDEDAEDDGEGVTQVGVEVVLVDVG
jgi:hypothetical protein